MNLLDRNQLLKKEELEIVEVVLGNDEKVFVRQMTGRERDRFEQTLVREVKDKKGNVTYEKTTEDFRAKLAVCTVCDGAGKLIFEVADYSVLSQNMSAARLEKIVNAAQKLNKITEDSKEDALKNSDAGETGNSTSDSAEN